MAAAQSLTIGLASEPTAADPHYHKVTTNDAFSAHIFESLINRNAQMELIPGLAQSWRAVDDNTWELKLRQGVKFSNGEPFTSKDVLFTLCRVLNNETNVSRSYMEPAQSFSDVQTPDDYTVIIKSERPIPTMPNELARSLPIIWSGIAKFDKLRFAPKEGCGVTSPWPTVADFNTGKLSIGTGPYKLKSYVKGNGIEMERNEGYWGTKPHWKTVKMVPVPNAGPRLTGLMSGDYDVIESPAARDLPRIKENNKLDFVATPSTRLVFFQPDAGRAQSPFAKSADGKNPLQDLRVRQAINMAIDRKAIVQRLMDGMATVANQYMPTGMFGSLDKPTEIKFDPEAAKKLLAEAGYPQGFELTLTTTNDRYINDGQIAQAVAQYLTRIGIKTTVDAQAAAIYFPKRAKREFSFAIGGWPSENGEASGLFQYWVATTDKDKGLGTSNYGGFSLPAFDQVFVPAMSQMDANARKAAYQQATQIALANVPLIPLHFESSIWAFKKGLSYEGRRDQYTLAMSVKPK
ncbi:ABC transporter substrate-binding protein [Comamonas piscis]|uniref:ABC transporter substrate-binding protein n=1 Tax=Comamonas piscis TaxID=1562974 RepID=A0A7G5ENN1_9BURK|nr:ABC transporter substrate-binding protein [Comamonas piscis]QMV75606.1 ABC transporter substrate-binding protein [Comamonas piscis]WSO36259.1 ABC transporter substrate-binding protein [Comamonas piscis]